ILISTDCMAEGIDLQFSADQIINYESFKKLLKR
ncbi:hypothetical protein LCGC14_0870110, partial [marine sediment metagenome]